MTIVLGLDDLRSSHMSSQFEGHRHAVPFHVRRTEQPYRKRHPAPR